MFWKPLLFASLLFCQLLPSKTEEDIQKAGLQETDKRFVDEWKNATWIEWRWQTIEEYQRKLLKVKNRLVGLHQILTTFKSSTAGGGTFIHWGSKNCPLDSPKLYLGKAAGGYSQDTGAAVDYLCPPIKPLYWPKNGNIQRTTGTMYGALYQVDGWKNYDVACSVCRSYKSKAIIMIPGRTDCYIGMKREYYGYLMAGRQDHPAATQYICVDMNQESFSSRKSSEGKLLYHVVSGCHSSLKCPPYQADRGLSCVVCSK